MEDQKAQSIYDEISDIKLVGCQWNSQIMEAFLKGQTLVTQRAKLQ
jgi:hypothetical protein